MTEGENINVHGPTEDLDVLMALVDDFSTSMKKRLIEKHHAGYHGWNDPAFASAMETSFDIHCAKALDYGDPMDYVDAANLAAMLWNLSRKG